MEDTKLPDVVFGLWWQSDYAGDVPADTLVAGDVTRDSPRFTREGETTYDGVHRASRGSFQVREHKKPKSIRTLEEKFGDRVLFDVCRSGEDVGCWIDEKPHRFDLTGGGYPEWTWNREERDFLWVCVVAREGKSQDDVIRECLLGD